MFEKAYVEYRLNKSEDALKTIESANLNPLPANLKELKAQVLYRLENFDECFNLYKDTSSRTPGMTTRRKEQLICQLSIEGTVSWIHMIQ